MRVHVRLPRNPKNTDYEGLVAATFLASGFFIESNLHLRHESTELLELDVLATPSSEPLDNTILVEAKSGRAGFGDIFKVSGWMNYLGIDRGCVVVPKKPAKHDKGALEAVCSATNVDLHVLSLDNLDLGSLVDSGPDISEDRWGSLIAAGWFGRLAQRKCLREFESFAKSGDAPELQSAREYRWAVQQALFEATPIARARRLYMAYSDHAQVTNSLIEFLSEGNSTKKNQITEAYRDTSKRLNLQYTSMLENTARLGIVKNALLRLLQREREIETTPETGSALNWTKLADWLLPLNFRSGLTQLGKHPYRLQIPHLLQLYVEVFGGFHAIHEDRDLNALSECTGIPSGQIPECLNLLDEFFPIPGGWFIEAKGELRFLKGIPAVYRGTGCFLRRALFDNKPYGTLQPKMGFLLSKWHDALVYALAPEYQVESGSSG